MSKPFFVVIFIQATEGESSGVVDQPLPPESPRPPTGDQRQRQEEQPADVSLDTYVHAVDLPFPLC